MAAITVKFERDINNTHTFENVANVEWSNEYADDFIVNQTSQIGHKVTNITVNGFIRASDPTGQSVNITEQQALEDALRGVGTGTLSYTGATDIANVRFVGLDFEEYNGTSIAQFSAKFVTEANNVHAHSPVTIGGQDLIPSEGFELPEVEDAIGSQGPDEQINNLKKRTLTISGRMVGTLSQVNAAQANLIAAVENQNTVTVSISAGSGGVTLNVRPREISFGSPERRGSVNSRTYRFSGVTHDDYTVEPYTLGETAQSFAGISIDVVEGRDHNVQIERESTSNFVILEESYVITGKKYFANRAAYDSFLNDFTPFPVSFYVLVDPTVYNGLELVDINIGAFQRDGNFPSEAKRYSAQVTLNFKWVKQIPDTNQNYLSLLLGINWFRVSSTNHSFTIDAAGNVTNRSVTLTGKIFDTELPNAKNQIGAAVNLNDAGIPGGTSDYYITGFNISSTDRIYAFGVLRKVHDISVTASQLGTDTQRAHFIIQTFNAQTGLLFENMTGTSRSLSNRWTGTQFITTSMNISVSGEIWEQDLAGEPVNPNRGRDYLRLFDSTQTANLTTSAAASQASNESLPTNYSFFVTNINVGQWQPFTVLKPVAGSVNFTKGQQAWRQTISISATAVFDLTGSSSGASDTVETENVGITEQTTKFTELRVMGFGTVFKAIGIEPATANSTITIQYKDKAVLEQNIGNLIPGFRDPPFPSAQAPFSEADSELTKDTFEVRGLTARWSKAWKATVEA